MKGKILFILSLTLFLFPSLAWGYQVTDIRAQDLEERTRITIITDCPKYESFAVREPDRLVIDLEADLLFLDNILVINKGAVTKVWVSLYRYDDGRQVTRVVIGLTQASTYRINRIVTGLMIDIAHPVLKAEAPPERIEIAPRRIKKIKGMGKGRNIGRRKFKIETGYEWDKRNIETTSGKDSTRGKYSKAYIKGLNCRYDDRHKRDMLWVKGTYGFTDFLDVFTKLGGVRSRSHTHDMAGTTDWTLNTNYDFAWGAGLRANIYEWPNGVYVNSSFEYLRGKHADKIVYIAGSKQDVNAEWQEWIGRVESGWKIKRFIPYLGVQYSDFETKLDLETPTAWSYYEAEAKENWGGFYGLDIQLPRDFQINYESHFGDKESYMLFVGYKF